MTRLLVFQGGSGGSNSNYLCLALLRYFVRGKPGVSVQATVFSYLEQQVNSDVLIGSQKAKCLWWECRIEKIQVSYA